MARSSTLSRPRQKPSPVAAQRQPFDWNRLVTPACYLTLFLVTFAVYGQMTKGIFPFLPGRQFDFISLDDGDYFTQNPNIKLGLTPATVRWAFTENFSANWHPLTWTSLMLDVSLYGPQSGGPHVTNFLLHLGSTMLIFALVRKMTDRLVPSLLVAAFWAVHPLHAESVAWVSERKDALSTFFALWALLAYANYAERPSWWRYLLVPLAFTLSLLSKQMWVTFPFVLMLLDFWPLGRTPIQGLPACRPVFSKPGWRWLFLEKVPLLAMTFGFSIMIFIVQRQAGAVVRLDAMGFDQRISNVLYSYWIYIFKTFWPTRLGIMYPHPIGGYQLKTVLLCALALTIITAVAVWKWRRWPWLITGWFWYLGTLVPVIGLVQIGSQSWADRYAYVPHIGLFMALIWSGVAIVDWLSKRMSPTAVRGGAIALAVVALIALIIRGNQQVALWENTEKLFAHTVAVADNNYSMATTLAGYLAAMDKLEDAKRYYRMALNMDISRTEALVGCGSTILNNGGDVDEAIRLFDRALSIDPEEPLALLGMGMCKLRKKKIDEAVELFEKVPPISKRQTPMAYISLGIAESQRGNSEKTREYFQKAVDLDPTEPAHLMMLGSFYLNTGEFDKAEKLFYEVLHYSPNDLGARLDLGILCVRKGQINEAMKMFQDAVAERPANADAHNRLAGGLMAQGKVAQAMAEFGTAIRLRPDWAPPYNDLAWTLATDNSSRIRSGREAVRLAEKAVELTKREDPAMLDTLAAAYAEAGRWDDAVRTAQEAIALAKKYGDVNMASQILTREELYRKRQPYRASAQSAAEAVRVKS